MTTSMALSAPSSARREDVALVPFHRPEAISTRDAAHLAGVTAVTMRLWVERYRLGRRVGGVVLVSKPALIMHLEGDKEALRLYHKGNRADPRVTSYFERCGIDPAAVFGAGDTASVGGGDA